jgi:hypothetical protein
MKNGWENVFELWRGGGEKLPFSVRRRSWNPAVSFFVVEGVEIKNWPYGKAWGRFRGQGPVEQLQCAGCYQWERVE